MHRSTSDANLFFPIQEVDVRSYQPLVWRGGPHRIVTGGSRVLRSGAIDPGGKSETPSPPRNHHPRFGRRASIGRTPASSMVAREKQRGGSGARASGGSRRQAVEATRRQDHGDGGPETRIKRRDESRRASHRHKQRS